MPWIDKDYIKLPDLYVAYRKAKSEAFSDSNCAHGLNFASYEQDLPDNLRRLFHLPEDGKALKVNLPYHATTPESELLFVTAKQKIFQLEGAHGLDLINPIEEQIRVE